MSDRASVRWDPNDPAKLAQLCADVRALRAELVGLRQLMDERNTRYEQSFRESKDAVQAALEAAKDQTAASFLASEKAIGKAEASQTAYNVGHNDLTRKMDAQYKEMLPRPEADSRFKSIEEKLSELREYRSGAQGHSSGTRSIGDALATVVALIIAAGAVVVAIVMRK